MTFSAPNPSTSSCSACSAIRTWFDKSRAAVWVQFSLGTTSTRGLTEAGASNAGRRAFRLVTR